MALIEPVSGQRTQPQTVRGKAATVFYQSNILMIIEHVKRTMGINKEKEF